MSDVRHQQSCSTLQEGDCILWDAFCQSRTRVLQQLFYALWDYRLQVVYSTSTLSVVAVVESRHARHCWCGCVRLDCVTGSHHAFKVRGVQVCMREAGRRADCHTAVAVSCVGMPDYCLWHLHVSKGDICKHVPCTWINVRACAISLFQGNTSADSACYTSCFMAWMI